MLTKTYFLFPVLLVFAFFFNAKQPNSVQPTKKAAAPNTLTEEERKKGWIMLFDGKTTNGWRNYNKQTIGENWKVADGALYLAVEGADGWQAKGGGDIVTNDEYENYEFRLEWKIGKCGNSGIMFNVKEDPAYQYPWNTGPEMQVLDNTCHPDAKIIKHRAGDLYDLITAVPETVKPQGEWNKVRLVVNKGHLEHWLNDKKVVDTQMWTDEWNNMIAGSKFKTMKDFGKIKKGRLALQDHGNPVWFRNIKIRNL
jgi:cytochrome c